MPIVNVEIVLREDEILPKNLAIELADELGELFHSPARGTWVKIHSLHVDQYAENGGVPPGVYPIFVTIVKAELPAVEVMQREVEKVTGAVAQICNRPSENVHVIYEPEARGRVAFGGKLVL